MSEQKVKPVPAGMHTVIPALTIRGCAAAIDFYKEAFGAVELDRAIDPSGKLVWHASLRIGDAHVFVNDEFPGMGAAAPEPGSAPAYPVGVWLYLDNVDGVFAKAVAAGAKVAMPLMDMFWGDRFGRIVDPFGHHWSLAQHVKDMTPEEMKHAEEEFKKSIPK